MTAERQLDDSSRHAVAAAAPAAVSVDELALVQSVAAAVTDVLTQKLLRSSLQLVSY